jgi:hypothetical protein
MIGLARSIVRGRFQLFVVVPEMKTWGENGAFLVIIKGRVSFLAVLVVVTFAV